MKPEEILSVLDQATSLAPLTRQQHQQVVAALEAMKKIFEDNKAKTESAKPSPKQ